MRPDGTVQFRKVTENNMEITPEVTEQFDAARDMGERLKDEDTLRQVIINAAAHAKMRQDEAAMKDLRRLGVAVFNSDGTPRPVADIILEAGQKSRARYEDRLRSEGKMVFMSKELDNVRITASGSVYVVDPKNTNTWRRVKGQAAIEIKQALLEKQAKAKEAQQPVVTQ